MRHIHLVVGLFCIRGGSLEATVERDRQALGGLQSLLFALTLNKAHVHRSSELVLGRSSSSTIVGSMPISPSLNSSLRPLSENAVLVRYFHDGGRLKHGRLLSLEPKEEDAVRGSELLQALRNEGVDLRSFHAYCYETRASTGAWLVIDNETTFPLYLIAADGSRIARRIDVKLMRSQHQLSMDEEMADNMADTPSGRIQHEGYFGIGIEGAKNADNIGTLWRTAFQVGAAFLFVIGTRYQKQSTDTLSAASSLPFFELKDWSAFAEFAPQGAKWVGVEMGGTPLEEFEHPDRAVYILGSEDSGLSKTTLHACHEIVSLSAEQYASYNVAVAGSIVAYDRMVKMRSRRKLIGRGAASQEHSE